MSKTVPVPSHSNPPNHGASSVLYVSIGGKRYEIRTTVEAREIKNGPAEVIEMSNREERPPTEKLR